MDGTRDLAYQDYLAGMKYKDIAEKYNVSLSTVKSWAVRYWKKDATAKECCNRNKAKTQPDPVVASADKKRQDEKKNETTIDSALHTAIEETIELTEKEKFFCLCYLKNFNATQAALSAGYSPNCPRQIGYELLTKPHIRKEIERLKWIKGQMIFASTDDVVERNMQIAFSDITDYVEFGVKTVPVVSNGKIVLTNDAVTGDQIPLLQTVNYAEVKSSTQVDGSLISEIKCNEQGGVSLKLKDSQKALEWLSQYFLMNPMDRHRIEYDKKKHELIKQRAAGRLDLDELFDEDDLDEVK